MSVTMWMGSDMDSERAPFRRAQPMWANIEMTYETVMELGSNSVGKNMSADGKTANNMEKEFIL